MPSKSRRFKGTLVRLFNRRIYQKEEVEEVSPALEEMEEEQIAGAYSELGLNGFKMSMKKKRKRKERYQTA